MVEGGMHTLHMFISAALWDEAWVFKSSQAIGTGHAAPALHVAAQKEIPLSDNKLTVYTNTCYTSPAVSF
jgi:riboflavin biosynthesis pyrimidine reductase